MTDDPLARHRQGKRLIRRIADVDRDRRQQAAIRAAEHRLSTYSREEVKDFVRQALKTIGSEERHG